MKGIILEVKETGVNVMDAEGSFSFVPGFANRKIGDEIEFAQKPVRRSAAVLVRRLAIAASFVILIAAGLISWNAAPSYVYVDINPAVEMAVNFWGASVRVSGVNDDGARVIEGANISGPYDGALASLLDAARAKGYDLTGGAGKYGVIVMIVSGDGKKAEAECARLSKFLDSKGFDGIALDHCGPEYRARALELGVSPGRLKIAERLRELTPAASLDQILAMTIGEIYAAIDEAEAAARENSAAGGSSGGIKQENPSYAAPTAYPSLAEATSAPPTELPSPTEISEATSAPPTVFPLPTMVASAPPTALPSPTEISEATSAPPIVSPPLAEISEVTSAPPTALPSPTEISEATSAPPTASPPLAEISEVTSAPPTVFPLPTIIPSARPTLPPPTIVPSARPTFPPPTAFPVPSEWPWTSPIPTEWPWTSPVPTEWPWPSPSPSATPTPSREPAKVVWYGSGEERAVSVTVTEESTQYSGHSGVRLPSGEDSEVFPGVCFIWEPGSPDAGYLKVSAGVFDEYGGFVITVKQENLYWNLRIDVMEGQEMTGDGCYVFFSLKVSENRTNDVFINV